MPDGIEITHTKRRWIMLRNLFTKKKLALALLTMYVMRKRSHRQHLPG
jgi:hypothetical protein